MNRTPCPYASKYKNATSRARQARQEGLDYRRAEPRFHAGTGSGAEVAAALLSAGGAADVASGPGSSGACR